MAGTIRDVGVSVPWRTFTRCLTPGMACTTRSCASSSGLSSASSSTEFTTVRQETEVCIDVAVVSTIKVIHRSVCIYNNVRVSSRQSTATFSDVTLYDVQRNWAI